jgi:hypothetical protein
VTKDLFGTDYDPSGAPKIATKIELATDLIILTYKQLRQKYWSEYGAWRLMQQRRYRLYDPRFCDYGGRGIKVCERWLERIQGFKKFMEDVGPKPGSEYSIHRIDNDLGYSPGNCKWATTEEQLANKRSYSSSLTKEDVNDIRAMYKTGKYTQSELGAIFDVERSIISRIVNYVSRRNIEAIDEEYGTEIVGKDLFK